MLPTPCILRTTYRRYHALLLATNVGAWKQQRIAFYDDCWQGGTWRVLLVDAEKVQKAKTYLHKRIRKAA